MPYLIGAAAYLTIAGVVGGAGYYYLVPPETKEDVEGAVEGLFSEEGDSFTHSTDQNALAQVTNGQSNLVEE